MAKNQPMEKKSKHFIAITTSIILAILIILIIVVLATTLTLPTGYKLVFNVDGQVTTSLEVKAKDEVVLADPAPKDGYTFGGWYFDNDTFTEPCTPETLKDKKLKGENTIYAKWIKNDYTIKYELNGGENAKANPSGYVVDTATIKLAAPTKLGYTFDGWYGKADFKDKAITEIVKGSTGNKELFAKWTKATYTIAYELNGGVEVTANATTYAIDTATITLNAPTKLGYTFDGWCEKSDLTDTPITEIATGSTGNKTLFAKWTAIEYGITYNLDGGINGANPTTYTIDTTTITLNDPTKVGYTFGGWYSEDSFATKVTEIAKGSTENKTFYANWTINTYTIQFNSNGGGGVSGISYNILAMPSSFAAPTAKTGYTFAAWYDNATFEGNAITSITLENIGNKTLFAKWTAIVYGITYEPNGGTNSIDNPATYTIATPTITLAKPTKLGYSFDGWYSEADFKDKAITEIAIGSTENKTFYANWTSLHYGITYELNGGNKNHPSNPATYTIEDSTIQLQTPTHGKNWMSCDGWYTAATGGEKVTTIATGSTGNLKLHAHWSFTGTPGLTYAKSADGLAYEVSGSTATGAIGIPSKHEEAGETLPVNIAENAFKDNTKITSVVIDEGVTSIDASAFYGCTSLTSVVIPNTVKSIGGNAFRGCSVLASVNIPSSVTSIGNYAFKYCYALTSVVMQNGVTSSIGVQAFYDCTALTSVKIHSSVQSIGANAFYGCSMLTSIFIPSSVTTMGYDVFGKCTSLTISCEIAQANVPVPDDPHTTGWHATWMGNVPTGNILWSQTRPIVTP